MNEEEVIYKMGSPITGHNHKGFTYTTTTKSQLAKCMLLITDSMTYY